MTDIAQAPAAPPKKPKRVRPPSRIKRWETACANAREALDAMTQGRDDFEQAIAELREVQEEYENWKDGLPDNLANSPVGEKLEEVCNIDIEDIATSLSDAMDTAESALSEAEGVELPRGFGKD